MLRTIVLATAIPSCLAMLLCFIPLFDLLGYEFGLAINIATIVSSCWIGIRIAHGANTNHFVKYPLAQLIIVIIGHLIPPLLIISANALHVRNCDFTEGLKFFLLLPLPSALYSGVSAFVISLLTSPKWNQKNNFALSLSPRPRLIYALIALFFVLPLTITLWQLYCEPPIFFYDHLFGYFAGSLYDEEIRITSTLLWFRAATVVRTIIIASIPYAFCKLQQRELTTAQLKLVIIIGLISLTGLDRVWGITSGYIVDRGVIEKELSMRLEYPAKDPTLVLHLPSNTAPKIAQEILADHQFRLAQISKKLGGSNTFPIHSYIYHNASQKARLMGGRNTMFAKPWLHEIHIHGVHAPHQVMPHEMAHAIAAEFASTPLKVSSRYGILVNMGIIEGIAEAVTPPKGDLDLHHYAKQLYDNKQLPPLEQILGSNGFWRQPARRAYTVAGSFLLYLLHTYGAPKWQQLYRNGDFKHAYNIPLSTLVTEWKTMLDSLTLLPKQKKVAQEHLRSVAIFDRPCAHVIASLRNQARNTSKINSIRIHKKICHHLNNSTTAQLGLANALKNAGQSNKYIQYTNALLLPGKLNAARRAILYSDRANLLWAQGQFVEAKHELNKAFELGGHRSRMRLWWVTQWALSLPPKARTVLQKFLHHKVNIVTSVIALTELLQTVDVDDKLTLHYLLGRQLLQRGAWLAAIHHLAQAGPHGYTPIEAERLRQLADAYAENSAENSAGNSDFTDAIATLHKLISLAKGSSRSAAIGSAGTRDNPVLPPVLPIGEVQRAQDAIERLQFRQQQLSVTP